MKRWNSKLFAACAVVVATGCAMQTNDGTELDTTSAELSGSVAGSIPTGVPARLTVGLFEDTGGTWMRNSGVPWDTRYRYFTKGWVNNWGWSGYDGSWGLSYMRECDGQGRMPAIQYYQMNGEAGGGEGQFLQKVQNASTMRSYFGDFKILMQRAKDFGKPVYVLLEADGPGFLQSQSGSNPNAYAAVAASGMPELAGLPNTVAGWGLAFLQIRKAVGANNAILGMHISGWASGKDLFHSSVTDALQPEVDKVYNFLAPLGVASNVTGSTYDVLVGDPLDRDADYYRLVLGQDRWWDASDSASISSKSFNRYAEWLRLWNVKSNKRWVLWQIPLGNSNHRNVSNDGSARAGYKDNRPEYFFGTNGAAHRDRFASAGVIALMFGAGTGGMSWYSNDQYTDGQLFMQSRAGAFLRTGGLAIPAGPSGGTSPPPPPPPPPPTSTARYSFESGTQGWTRSAAPISAVARSTTVAADGAASLQVSFSGTGTASTYVNNPGAIASGATVTFRLWVPAGSRIAWVQPYLLEDASRSWRWTGNWQPITALQSGVWNTITVRAPTNAGTMAQLGVQYSVSSAWTGQAYIDGVTW